MTYMYVRVSEALPKDMDVCTSISRFPTVPSNRHFLAGVRREAAEHETCNSMIAEPVLTCRLVQRRDSWAHNFIFTVSVRIGYGASVNEDFG
jgi:hypothetical protein